MSSISLDRVNKVYGDTYHAIHDLSLDVADGEFLVLVGPSGCGKSTALRMIAGLETITAGDLRVGDKRVNSVDPKDRDIAMVFQSYALYPHMSVRENIGFPLRMARLPKDEVDRRIEAAAATLQLDGHLDRKPANLSGGQRQRVAMGRAIVRQPSAFLMDEPLSNLDAKLRVQMRAEIARLQKELGITTIYVTHDQTEAMTMGDRVAILKDGHLQQVDTPQTLYDRPANAFVAAFIGSPAMNLYEARWLGGAIELGGQRIETRTALAGNAALDAYRGKAVVVGIRPEDFADPDYCTFDGALLDCDVALMESLGSERLAHFSIDAPMVDAGDPDADAGLESGRLSVARLDSRTALIAGDRAQLSINIEKLHLFDPEDHRAIR